MNLNLNKRKILISLSYLFFNIIIFIFIINYWDINYESWLEITGCIIIFHFIFTLITLKICKINIISFIGIFINFIYIFHFSQIILKFISKNYEYKFDVSMIVPFYNYKNSIVFSLIIVVSTTIGGILSYKNKAKKYKEYIIDVNNELKLAWSILIISLPLELYFSVNEILVGRQGNYLEVLKVESSGILSQIARFHIIGIVLLILCYSILNRLKAKVVLVVYILYSLFTMTSGSRIYQSIYIIICIYFYVKINKIKINFKNSIKVMIPLFIFLIFINVIAEARLVENIDLYTLGNIIRDKVRNNPIFGVLEEFGATIYTVCITNMIMPGVLNFTGGSQFLTSFFSVLPNIGGMFTEINSKSNFVLNLDVVAIGGSYVAEMYYSFESLHWLFAILAGFIIGQVSNKIEIFIEERNFIGISYRILFMFSIILWVRGAYIGILRNTIWSIIYIYILRKIIGVKIKKGVESYG